MVTYWLTVDGGRFLFSRHIICGRAAEFVVHMNLFLVVAGVCFRMTCLNWKERIRAYGCTRGLRTLRTRALRTSYVMLGHMPECGPFLCKLYNVNRAAVHVQAEQPGMRKYHMRYSR